jgi:hypothetical protein
MVTRCKEARTPPAARTIRCGFCGGSFAEDRGQPACRGCPLGSGCGSIRCPACGYENTAAPAWLDTLVARASRWRRKLMHVRGGS